MLKLREEGDDEPLRRPPSPVITEQPIDCVFPSQVKFRGSPLPSKPVLPPVTEEPTRHPLLYPRGGFDGEGYLGMDLDDHWEEPVELAEILEPVMNMLKIGLGEIVQEWTRVFNDYDHDDLVKKEELVKKEN